MLLHRHLCSCTHTEKHSPVFAVLWLQDVHKTKVLIVAEVGRDLWNGWIGRLIMESLFFFHSSRMASSGFLHSSITIHSAFVSPRGSPSTPRKQSKPHCAASECIWRLRSQQHKVTSQVENKFAKYISAIVSRQVRNTVIFQEFPASLSGGH